MCFWRGRGSSEILKWWSVRFAVESELHDKFFLSWNSGEKENLLRPQNRLFFADSRSPMKFYENKVWHLHRYNEFVIVSKRHCSIMTSKFCYLTTLSESVMIIAHIQHIRTLTIPINKNKWSNLLQMTQCVFSHQKHHFEWIVLHIDASLAWILQTAHRSLGYPNKTSKRSQI